MLLPLSVVLSGRNKKSLLQVATHIKQNDLKKQRDFKLLFFNILHLEGEV